MTDDSCQNLESTVLGFDYGTRCIGVAVGVEMLESASTAGVVPVSAKGVDEARIRRLVEKWRPHKMIVGLPKTADGTKHSFIEEVEAFGEWLQQTFRLPVVFVDERYSTEAAKHHVLADRKTTTQEQNRRLRNEIAAVIIVESFFQARRAR